jgi:hypothetical protein
MGKDYNADDRLEKKGIPHIILFSDEMSGKIFFKDNDKVSSLI